MAYHRSAVARHEEDCSKNGVNAVILKQQMQQFKTALTVFVSDKVDDVVDEMQQSAVCRSCASHSPTNNNNEDYPSTTTTKPKDKHNHRHEEQTRLFFSERMNPEINFTSRQADRKEGTLLLNYAASLLIMIVGYTVIMEYLEHGWFSMKLDLLWWGFSTLPITMCIWFGELCGTVLVYVVYQYWANIPRPPTAFEKKLLFVGYISWLALHLYLPCKYVLLNELTPPCVYIISCEQENLQTLINSQMRLYMKVHSFVRENWPKTMKWKKDSLRAAHPNGACPAFEKYVYFLFAPTLLYRDEYPRTARTDWSAARAHLCQGLLCVLYSNYILIYFVLNKYENFSPSDTSMLATARAMFDGMLPGFAILLLLFWGLVHSWANMWSEILRFADRHFYTEWWNARRMSSYYRGWNLVVHEWLYEYVMKDMAIIVNPKRSKVYGAIVVFLISSVFHEYSFIIGFRVFIPVLLTLYTVGGPGYYFLSRMVESDAGWNILMFANLTFGQGLFVALYSREWYARVNCAPVYEGIWDALIPMSWSCQQLK